ncbi:CLUMA_CG020380, isoform A [Clunio marinus]|uniref:CLUMA_CG020380, isoform A n=1 Tax=Clunio marinus TaxID=568069 RepID=A0A1J1J4U1_9DIPT|nr:CLUMA_CG020380, isoform A [Clunio marinus]
MKSAGELMRCQSRVSEANFSLLFRKDFRDEHFLEFPKPALGHTYYRFPNPVVPNASVSPASTSQSVKREFNDGN